MKNKFVLFICFIVFLFFVSGCGKKEEKKKDIVVSELNSIQILSKADEAEAAKLIKNNIVRITNQIDEKTKIVGTGFFIKEGYLLTNSHIVDIKGDISIEYSDGTKQEAFLYSNSIEYDLALLKVEEVRVKSLSLISSDELKVTNDVLGAGFIYNFAGEASVAKGILSARRDTEFVKYLQSDLSIDSGASGGPLFNAKAGIVGINTFVTENRTFTLAISSESAQLIVDILIEDPIVEYLTKDRPSNAINSILVEIGYTTDDEFDLYNDSEIISNNKNDNANVNGQDSQNNSSSNSVKYYCDEGYMLIRNKCVNTITYDAEIEYESCKNGYTKVNDNECKKSTIVPAKASYYCLGTLTKDNTCIEQTIEVGGEIKQERWGSCPAGKTCYDLGNNRATNTTNKKFVSDMSCPEGSTKITHSMKFVWNGEDINESNIKSWNTSSPGAVIAKDKDGTVYYEDTPSVLAMCAMSYDKEQQVYTLYTYDELKDNACPNGGTFTANTKNQGFYCLLSTSIHRYAWDPECTNSVHSWMKYGDTYYCGRLVDQEYIVNPGYSCDAGVMQNDGKSCLVEDIYYLSPTYTCPKGGTLQGTSCINKEVFDAKKK